MKSALLSILVAPCVMVALSLAAAAAESETLVPSPASAPPAFTVCEFGGSCPFEKFYAPGARSSVGGYSLESSSFTARHGKWEGFFDKSFDHRQRLMEHCISQKPKPWPYPNQSAWQWKQSHQEYPLPADPNADIALSSAQRSLANYQYCMLHR